jgi:HSP20 family molecular chaperone IbpA
MIACDVPFGPFMRSFPLTTRVAPDRVAARLADGVLTIRLHAGARPKSSEVSIMS